MLTQSLVEYLKQLLFGYGQFNNILQTQVWVFALEHNQHFKQGWFIASSIILQHFGVVFKQYVTNIHGFNCSLNVHCETCECSKRLNSNPPTN
jgi:hypothetical protein